MQRTNGSKSKDAAEEDFGFEGKFREYHDHGGPQGDGRAKELEGEIAASDARHGHQLKKARPDSSATRRK